jgi:hypothetical protein
VFSISARRFEVEDAERGVGERRAEVVEAALDRRPNPKSHGCNFTANARSLSRTGVRRRDVTA